MENAEGVLQVLEEFTKLKPKDIPKELEEYFEHVAKTGDPVFQWSVVKYLFREKLSQTITDFYENCPTLELPTCPNVEPFTFETMKHSLLERIDSFSSAPFTVQRICELLVNPRKEYSRVDKYMRAIEKNVLVVSTKEPCIHKKLETNTQPELLMNGIIDGRIELGEAVETVSSEGVNLMHENELSVPDSVRLECSTSDEIEMSEPNDTKTDTWEGDSTEPSVSSDEVKTYEGGGNSEQTTGSTVDIIPESDVYSSVIAEPQTNEISNDTQEAVTSSGSSSNDLVSDDNSAENKTDKDALESKSEKECIIEISLSNEEETEDSVISEESDLDPKNVLNAIDPETSKNVLSATEPEMLKDNETETSDETKIVETDSRESKSQPIDNSQINEVSALDETNATVIVEQVSEILSEKEDSNSVTSSVTVSELDSSVDITNRLDKETEPVMTAGEDTKEVTVSETIDETIAAIQQSKNDTESENKDVEDESSNKLCSTEDRQPEFEAVESPVDVSESLVEVSGSPVEVSGSRVEVSGSPVEVSASPVEVSTSPVEVSASPVEVSASPVESKIVEETTEAVTITEENIESSVLIQEMEQVSSSGSQDEAMEVDDSNNQPMEVEVDEPMDQSDENVDASGQS